MASDYVVESLGSMLAVLPLLGVEEIRKEAITYFRSGPFLFCALMADEVFDFLGRGAFIFAYSVGSVALVSSVSALQPFITLFYIIPLGPVCSWNPAGGAGQKDDCPKDCSHCLDSSRSLSSVMMLGS